MITKSFMLFPNVLSIAAQSGAGVHAFSTQPWSYGLRLGLS